MSKLNPTKLPVVSNAKIGCRTLEKKHNKNCYVLLFDYIQLLNTTATFAKFKNLNQSINPR